MGFPPLLNLSTRLSTAALPGQTTKTALTEEFMFQNVAYRPTVYRTGIEIEIEFEILYRYSMEFQILNSRLITYTTKGKIVRCDP